MSEFTECQMRTLSSVSGIKPKILKKYFSYYNPPYDKNERKEYLFSLIKGDVISSLKKFTFLLNNIKTREMKDIVLTNSRKFGEAYPNLFDNA
jgi:hypothetical protein